MGRPKGSKNKPKLAVTTPAQTEEPVVAVVQPTPAVAAPAPPAVAVIPPQPPPEVTGVQAPVKRRGRPPKEAKAAPEVTTTTAEIPVRQSKAKEVTKIPGTKPGLAGNWTNTEAAIQAKAAEPKALNEQLVSNITLMTQEDTPKKYPAEWAEFRKRANRDRQLIKFLADIDTDQLIFAHECLDAYPETVPVDMTATVKFLLEEVTGKLLEIKENK